jgi:hypothetical protein
MCISLDDPNERYSTPSVGTEQRTRGWVRMMEAITTFIEANRGSFALGYKEQTGEWMAVIEYKVAETHEYPSEYELEPETVYRPATHSGVGPSAGDAIETLLKEAGL